ncbi:MAG: HD domain-containing protein [Candidatus Omnitrophica bacterium]|nr:HD domain-containing protein [Candidatus Omnitrophota bacterium]
MKNIVLTGFMGTGKTVVSKALAKDLNMTYVSTDDLVEVASGRSIKDIFAEKGEAYFREKEKKVIQDVCEHIDQIIDAGGGAVLDPENMKCLKKNGIVVCLWADPEVILERTRKNNHRPLLSVDDPKRKVQELLEERKASYEHADFHVDTTMGDITIVVDKVIKMAGPGGLANLETGRGAFTLGLWELLLNNLLQNSESSVMITDKNGKVVFANKRYLEYFHMSSEKIMNKNWIDVIVPDWAREKVEAMLGEVKGANNACQFEIPVSIQNTKKRYFCWVSSPLQDKEHAYVMFAGQPDREMRNRFVDVHPATTEDMVDIIFASSIKNEPGTARHSLRVTSFAVALARETKMKEKDVENLRFAALLHDIGKLAIDEEILFKKGKLSEQEFDEIKKHPGWGVEMLKPVSFLDYVLPVMMSHHENFDGTGYPDGLKGDEIPYEARILAVADIYEALTADRPYRRAFSKEESIVIMEESKGKKLDPMLVDIFLDMVKRGRLGGDVKWNGYADKDAM